MKLTATGLENAALHYLGRYAATRASLQRVLLAKIRRGARDDPDAAAVARALIPALLDRYTASGLLNDAVFAAARASSLHRRGASTRAIAHKLGQKGVAKDTVSDTLAVLNADGDADITAAREHCRRKKLGPYRTRPDADPKRRQKDIANLARAGFRYDVILAALNEKEAAAVR